MKNPVIIGGAAIDLKGMPDAPLKPRASNLGVFRKSTGGVGLNIALNLAALGVEPVFISLVGDDSEGDFIAARCAAAGLGTERVARHPDETTAVYEAILDEHGELFAGISAMAIFARLTPAFLAPHANLIAGAPLVIMDANPPEDTAAWLAALARERSVPLWLEPTAFDTCGRFRSHLDGVSWISPNVEELEALAECSVRSPDDMVAAARRLVAGGVKEVFVTCGEGGVLHVREGAADTARTPVIKARDVTGAGDAFVAGTAYGLLQGMDSSTALRYGMAAAYLTVQVSASVHPGLTPELLEQTVRTCFP
jgi:pseudouridine kinase